MVAKCKYGRFLDGALRDRFVTGLRNPAVQTGLLKKKELTFKSALKLKTHEWAPLEVKGRAKVTMEYDGQRKALPVIVVPENKPGLLGRDWIENLDVELSDIHTVQAELMPDNLVKRWTDYCFSSQRLQKSASTRCNGRILRTQVQVELLVASRKTDHRRLS
ncbi:hypothetical protein HPB49_007002 [Dermacentor silvarum]|uniref:Uncharacterized protein n=1 Tax=Dermacentor silvarum TaxID=543639 RepID=A0ACB8CVY2_DERSI|nr:hypothetical protein HPB49_007002 [Dermacentor silvarum]